MQPLGSRQQLGWGAKLGRRPVSHLAALAIIAFLAAFFLWPIFLTVESAFQLEGRLSTYWFQRAVQNRLLMDQLLNGVVLALAATGISFLLGLPLAVLRARFRFAGQGLLSVAVLLPLILPPFVGALAVKQFFGEIGAFNKLLEQWGLIEIGPGQRARDWLAGGFWGVAILQALHLFPIVYLNSSAALANVDPAYQQAARNLGAGPVRTFLRVTLPLIRPGLFAGGTIVFIWSFTDIGTPLLMDYKPLVPVTIFNEIDSGQYTGRTFSLVTILLASSVLLYVLGKFVFGRATQAGSSKATVQAETRKLGAPGTLAAWVVFGVVIFLAILPHLGVILFAVAERWEGTVLPDGYTLRHLRAIVSRDDTYTSIVNSLQYAGVSTVVDLVVGGVAAWLIIRAKVAGRSVLDALVMLPLAVPGLILAAGYIAMTVPGSVLEFISPARDPFLLLVLAYSVRRLPFVVRGLSAGLEQVPESLEEAARNLGCSRTGTVRRVTVPLVMANIVAAGVLAFAFAMLEVSDSLVLAQQRSDYPITKQVYILFTAGTGDAKHVAAAMGVCGMILLGGTMATASLLLGRRLGAIFRA